jgi:hypothetical protein
MSTKETEFVTGTVNGVTQKAPDRWVIEVTPDGSQYSKKLHSKSVDQVSVATGLINQTATFECGVSIWEREGKPVRSLWVNAVNPGVASPLFTAPTTVRRMEGEDPARDSIERQTALKAAVEFHKGNDEATDGNVIETAALFAAFLRGARAPKTQPGDPDAYDGDEDIPF